MGKKKKAKKESWKERQRRIALKRQRASEAARIAVQKEIEERRKSRSRTRARKIFVAISLILLILIVYGVWQSMPHTQPSTEPPVINPTKPQENPPPTATAPDFSLRDVNGTRFTLSNYNGRVIAIHFMAVGCHGQIYSIFRHYRCSGDLSEQ
jgi:cytochrome b561